MTRKPTLITVHAGFHKTGTTSAQAFLRSNLRTIRRHADVVMHKRMEDALHFARKYAIDRDEITRNLFRFNFISFLGTLEITHRRPLVISAEDLCGTIPGYRGISDFSAAVDLAEDVVDALRHHFGENVPINLLYTVRDREPWLRSIWARHVGRGYMTQDFDEFAAGHADAVDVDRILQDIRARIGAAGLASISLEEVAAHEYGPGAIFLSPLQLPERAHQHLQPPAHKNRSNPLEKLAEQLARNRASGGKPIRRRKGG